MDVKSFVKKPRKLYGVEFDGSLSSAQAIQEWVQSSNGLACTLFQHEGSYALFVPSPTGTNALFSGMTLLADIDSSGTSFFYPISADDLVRNYDAESDPVAP